MSFAWIQAHSRWTSVFIGLVILCYALDSISCDGLKSEDTIDDVIVTKEPIEPADSVIDDSYVTPKLKPEGLFLYESFDDQVSFSTNWIQSIDSKYNGRWNQKASPGGSRRDLQLLLPEKARHYGISAKLVEPFKFSDQKPLVVQYEVQFQEGLDCGGAYIKLLSNSASNDLTKLTDKTPFTIMFGPDKCGSEVKLHFIIKYLNPKTQEYSEKHWKQAKFVNNLLAAFTDKQYHLFRLVLDPNNKFELFMDGKSVGSGDLLEDLDPAINPPKEITDPNDNKPQDWDERPQIDDPDAQKPDDWDENAPKTIEDASAVKPDDWLEDEPKYIPDPTATKPDDWEEMDGEWEPPKIANPACEKASGCGKWQPPQIPNPAFKGKWRPPKIDNPNYKGKWSPRMIPNPEYFFDENPFSSLDPIGAIAFELWSMADNVAFDNLIITSNVESADVVQSLTWQLKKAAADASSPSIMTRTAHYLNTHPWLWAIIVIAVALPLWLFITYCCDSKRSRASESAARRKKTDESRPDDEPTTSQNDQEETSEDAVDEEDVDDEEDDQVAAEKEEDKLSSKRQVRQRKVK